MIESLIRKSTGEIMGNLDAANAALDNAGTALTGLGEQTTQLAEQIAGLVAGQTTQEEIDALTAKAEGIASGITSAAAAVDAAYDPDAGEGEPTPTPGGNGGEPTAPPIV